MTDHTKPQWEGRGGRRGTTWKPGIKSPNLKGRPPMSRAYRRWLREIEPLALKVVRDVAKTGTPRLRKEARAYLARVAALKGRKPVNGRRR